MCFKYFYKTCNGKRVMNHFLINLYIVRLYLHKLITSMCFLFFPIKATIASEQSQLTLIQILLLSQVSKLYWSFFYIMVINKTI